MSERPLAIVTGGGRGIGRAISLELASLGFDILIVYFSDVYNSEDAAAQATKAEIAAKGVRAELVPADITNPDDRRRALEFAKSEFGRCDMLVNNAGVGPKQRADLLDATEESFDRVVGTNLKGPYFLTQATARWMVEQAQQNPQRRCRIVNIGSMSAYTSSTARGEYCISKAGVGMMTALFADRLAEYGIGVFEIRPGIIETDMTKVVKDKYDKMIAEGITPIKRWGKAEDIALAVGAIAQGRLDFSTGQVINVDGGFQLRRL